MSVHESTGACVVEADLERHVVEFVDDGYENVILGSGPVNVCFPKFTQSHESEVATVEFQAHHLFPHCVQLGRPRCIARTGFKGQSGNSQSFW